jgi:hypothetical protein
MASNGRKRTSKQMGRYVAPEARGRYTAPRPPSDDHSPHWYGWLLLDMMLFGVIVITLNYLQVLPGSVSSWYLVTGLVSMLVAFYLATLYR